MPEVPTVSLLNLKGGVGKTAVAVNVAAALALRGDPALVIDLDPQGSATDHLVDVVREPTSASLLTGLGSLSGVKQPVRPGTQDSAPLFLVPAGGFELTAAEVSLQARASKNRIRRVIERGRREGPGVRWIILDTGPGLDFLWYNALYASSVVLVPVELQMPAMQGLRRFHDLVDFARDEDGLDPSIYYVPTNNDGRLRESRDLLSVLHDQYGAFPDGLVLPSIRYSSALSKAYGQRQTVFEFSRTDRASIDCLAIADILRSIFP